MKKASVHEKQIFLQQKLKLHILQLEEVHEHNFYLSEERSCRFPEKKQVTQGFEPHRLA